MNSDLDETVTKAMIRKNARYEACMQEHLFERFKSEGHSGFVGNISVTLIDTTNGNGPKRRENDWMKTLKTHDPFRLNIEDSLSNLMQKYNLYC